MVAKRFTPAEDQPAPVCRMISAARAKEAPAQPVCSGALWLVCAVIVADQASMIWIALPAYRVSRVTYHGSAWVYAASASLRSSLQPWFGLDLGPHSTTGRGLGFQDSAA